MSLQKNIAIAIKDKLEADSYTESITASVEYKPQIKPEDINAAKVIVIPQGIDLETVNRRDVKKTVNDGLIIIKRVGHGSDSITETENMIGLVDEIIDSFSSPKSKLPGQELASWIETTATPLFDEDSLIEDGIFLSFVQLAHEILE